MATELAKRKVIPIQPIKQGSTDVVDFALHEKQFARQVHHL